MREQRRWLSAVLVGHYAYNGITGCNKYRQQVMKTWRQWRESCTRAKWLSWDRFNAFLARHPLPRARIVHRYATWNEALT